jgi:glycosyltransferase involved in cell wall biosynthesis
VRHEEDGLLVRCGDVDRLLESLERLVRNPGLRARLGAAGRARVAHEFRWVDKLDLVLRVYEQKALRTVYAASSS